MAEEFLSNFDRGSIPPNDGFPIPPSYPFSDPDRLRMLLMGSAASIRRMIHRFHVEGTAAAGDWSPIVPVPRSNEFMSILIIRSDQISPENG